MCVFFVCACICVGVKLMCKIVHVCVLVCVFVYVCAGVCVYWCSV